MRFYWGIFSMNFSRNISGITAGTKRSVMPKNSVILIMAIFLLCFANTGCVEFSDVSQVDSRTLSVNNRFYAFGKNDYHLLKGGQYLLKNKYYILRHCPAFTLFNDAVLFLPLFNIKCYDEYFIHPASSAVEDSTLTEKEISAYKARDTSLLFFWFSPPHDGFRPNRIQGEIPGNSQMKIIDFVWLGTWFMLKGFWGDKQIGVLLQDQKTGSKYYIWMEWFFEEIVKGNIIPQNKEYIDKVSAPITKDVKK